MAEQKSFWKRFEFLITAIITLLFIYSVVFFNQKINFLLGNELIVYLTPSEKSFSMHYGDIGKAEFGISIGNAAYCSASCSYSFNDRSKNEVIDRGDFKIKIGQHIAKEYNLSVKRLGSGQDIYSFDVSCHSIRSALCLTSSPGKYRSSLVTVNYDLTETEKILKDSLKQNVTKLLLLLADVDAEQQKLHQKHFELEFRINLNSLSKEKIEADDSYDKLVISTENLRSLWAVENYSKLSQLFNQSFFDTLDSINESISSIDIKIGDVLQLHNSLLSKLDGLSNELNSLYSFTNALNITIENLDTAISQFSNISSSITNNTFGNYEIFVKGIEDITSRKNLIVSDTKKPSAALLFNLLYFSKKENDMLCSLMQNCKENISVFGIINGTEQFLGSYPDSKAIRDACSSIHGLRQKFSDARNETSRIAQERNASFPPGDEFAVLASNFKDNEIRKINNSYYSSFNDIKLANKTNPDAIEIAAAFLPKNTAQITEFGNETSNITLFLLANLRFPEEAPNLLEKCADFEKPSKINEFNFALVSGIINYTIVPRISTSLSDNLPLCCVFNDCRPCCSSDSCKNDPKTFPIIFVHGHSLAKDNSPEFSLDSFNKMQSRLQGDGYLNAGIVSLYSQNEPAQKGIWGLSGKPVTVKASYYYDAFRKDDKYIIVPTKSENIDTYALRLRDLIAIVKERTNKPKVNLITHSMGSLVARRYIQIFGEDDVDKLIMIAAPNKGISGTAGNYCSYVGENRECQDMQANSLFMNKLNDQLKQPSKAKMHDIIGRGCQMDLGDGDGIATVESAELQNAKSHFINGTCGGFFGGTLHTEILDIEKYPETYEIVKEILRE